MRLYNTLSHRVEEFHPREAGIVRMYTCGPTVYRYAHIGNLRSYLMADWLRRTLQVQGLRVEHVKNITDVGHMRQELLEQDGDRIIQQSIAEGKSPRQIADFYTKAFLRDEARLNILPSSHFPRATDHIPEMQEIIQRLIQRGCAYESQGNVYFEVVAFPEYGKLSRNVGDGLLGSSRAMVDPLKRDPRDFALWKATEPGRELKWPSPWGEGFPGWHIECSAMSVKYLGQQLDIHTGGVDNIFPHHEGEIAQCESAFEVPFVRTWLHGQHLLVDGVKMAKSQGNAYTLDELESRGLDLMSFRYLCLTTHYRTRMNFTFAALGAAQRALLRLRLFAWSWKQKLPALETYGILVASWKDRFWKRVEDDLDLPGAIAVTWKMIGSNLPEATKFELLLEFDQVLGLDIANGVSALDPAKEALTMAGRREELRARSEYPQADRLRLQIRDSGHLIEDTYYGPRVRSLTHWEQRHDPWPRVSSSTGITSLLKTPDRYRFTVALVVCNHLESVQKCLESVLSWRNSYDTELLVIDNGSEERTADWLEGLASSNLHLRIIHTDHILGEGAAKNIALKQSQGTTVLLLDPSTEVTGDIFTPIEKTLAESEMGLVGPWGLRTRDLRHFEEVTHGEVHAMQAYCMAFPRKLPIKVGLFREGFRFYRNLDIDFSLQFRDRGFRIVALEGLSLRRHEHSVWNSFSPQMRDELSQLNFRRIIKKWGHRRELLQI